MTEQTVRRTGALLAAAALSITLASCASTPSVADDCAIATDAVNEVSTDVQDATTQYMEDVTSGEDADLNSLIAPLTEALESAEAEVTNDEVSAALSEVSDEFDTLSNAFDELEMPDLSEIDPTDPNAMAELKEIQEQSEEVSAELMERSQALGEAGKNLQKLCQG